MVHLSDRQREPDRVCPESGKEVGASVVFVGEFHLTPGFLFSLS